MTSSRNSDIARRIPDLRPRTGEPWTPPPSGQRLEHLLARFREWDPIDWAAVFEDLNLALEDHGPEENEVEELVERLRGILGEFAAAARSGRSRRGGRAAKAPGVAPTRRRAEDTSGARAWLKANGYEVADRGRIPQNLIDIWRENKDKPQAPKKEAEKSDELDTSDAAILAWHKDKGYKVPESGKVNGLMRHRYLKEHKLA